MPVLVWQGCHGNAVRATPCLIRDLGLLRTSSQVPYLVLLCLYWIVTSALVGPPSCLLLENTCSTKQQIWLKTGPQPPPTPRDWKFWLALFSPSDLTWVAHLDLWRWTCVLCLYVFARMPGRDYWIISHTGGIIYKWWEGNWLRLLSKCAEDCFGYGRSTYEFVNGCMLAIKTDEEKFEGDSCRVRLQSYLVFFILSLVNDSPYYGRLDWEWERLKNIYILMLFYYFS